MLQSLEDFKKAELVSGQLINGVDNPSLSSVDSTTPIETDADQLESEKEEKEEADVSKTAKKAALVKKEEKEEKEEDETKTEEEKEAALALQKKKEVSEDSDTVKKRIAKLTKNWRTAERDRDFEKDKRLKAEDELKKLQAKVPATDRPKKEDFEDEDEYLEALIEWKTELKLRTKAADISSVAEEDAEQTAITKTEEAIHDLVETGREKFEDFDEVAMSTDLKVSPVMMEVILTSDISVDIMYYLGKNPEIAADIFEMSPLKAAREIGKIEVALNSATPAAEEEETEEEKEEKRLADEKKLLTKKKKTKTPEPIDPLHTEGQFDKDPSKMSMKEYRAWREKNKE